MDKYRFYHGIVFTNHALSRLDDRWLTQEMVWQTIKSPVSESQSDGAVRLTKPFGDHVVTAVVKQNERKELVVISCWIDPPIPGSRAYKEKENYRRYQKAGFWGKIWWTFRSQLGF